MLLLTIALAQSLSLNASDQFPAAPPQSFPYTSNAGIDIGCYGVGLEGSSFPAQLYDPLHKERVTYNVSRCSGGYIHATDETTWKSWTIQIGPNGQVHGKDLTGAKWRYEKPRAIFVNLKTHSECEKPDYRTMCADPSP